MSQWCWQSARLKGTEQTQLNSRESQTDGIHRNHLKSGGASAPRGRRSDLRRERREENPERHEVCV